MGSNKLPAELRVLQGTDLVKTTTLVHLSFPKYDPEMEDVWPNQDSGQLVTLSNRCRWASEKFMFTLSFRDLCEDWNKF